MTFESFPTEENNEERSHEELVLRNNIQARLLGMKFGPDEVNDMVTWIENNGERIKLAIDELEAEHVDLGYLWEVNSDRILEMLNAKLSEGEQYRKAA